MINRVVCVCALAAFPAMVSGQTLIDFSLDGGGSPLVNGQRLTGLEFSPEFTMSFGGSNQGGAIFDTSNPGPNVGGPDPDLLVSLGNALILQSNDSPSITGGIFDTPNDSARNDGLMRFDFASPVELLDVTLIDVNGGNAILVTLFDGQGRTRQYDVPQKWTNDISVAGGNGYGVLDLTTLLDQVAETAVVATASESAGFDSTDVVALTFDYEGSGAIDNLRFVPAPGSVALLLVGALAARRRR